MNRNEHCCNDQQELAIDLWGDTQPILVVRHEVGVLIECLMYSSEADLSSSIFKGLSIDKILLTGNWHTQ